MEKVIKVSFKTNNSPNKQQINSTMMASFLPVIVSKLFQCIRNSHKSVVVRWSGTTCEDGNKLLNRTGSALYVCDVWQVTYVTVNMIMCVSIRAIHVYSGQVTENVNNLAVKDHVQDNLPVISLFVLELIYLLCTPHLRRTKEYLNKK